MPLRPVPSRRSVGAASLLVSCAVVAVLAPGATRGQTVTASPRGTLEAQGPVVPPVPDGTPAELLRFIEGLSRPATQPRSPEETAAYIRAAATAAVQAADKILVQVGPADAAFAEAARRKLASLQSLVRMGDEQAPRLLAAYAATLATSGNEELARDARLAAFSSEADAMFSSGALDAGPELLEKLVAEVSANPDDPLVAGAAMEFATDCERVPDGGPLAQRAYATLGPLLARSRQPRIRKLGTVFAGAARRLALPGRPMEIRGTLLDGTPFDRRSLAGKVVLVDFWATWCGPCVAEVPNMLTQYEKYHDEGFEIVGISLDEDRDALEQFIAAKKIPWPILHDRAAAEEGNVLARFYGITGIPQLILIGRDGNVITLNARGPRLAEELDKLFKDAG